MNKKFKPFSLGQIVATPAALQLLEETFTDVTILLARHRAGDWGCLDADDRKANDDATYNGGRILSSYLVTDTHKVWIITEADRSSTCLLLPEDY